MSASDAGQRSEQTIYKRDEQGKFMGGMSGTGDGSGAPPGGPAAALGALAGAPGGPGALGSHGGPGAQGSSNAPGGPGAPADPPQFSSLLTHVEQLEKTLAEREKELSRVKERVDGYTRKNRIAMESALKSMMDKWMSAVKTDDEKVKTDFHMGMDKLVKQGDDQNGVWRMMVAASALHEQQEHNLDSLRQENEHLKSRIDGHYAKSGARLQEDVLGKRKADVELDRFDVAADASTSLWSEFASEMANF